MYEANHMPKAARYVAFVSYSHVDGRDARWLHGRLEGYRVPRGVSSDGDDQDLKLSPIFRDRDELRAGPSLTESLREALRESGALIVLCSVDSAKST